MRPPKPLCACGYDKVYAKGKCNRCYLNTRYRRIHGTISHAIEIILEECQLSEQAREELKGLAG